MLARRDQWLEVVGSMLQAGDSDEHARDASEHRRSQAIALAIEAGILSLHRFAIADIEAELSFDQHIELAENAAAAATRLGHPWAYAELPKDIDGWRFISELIATRDGKPRSRLGAAQGLRDIVPPPKRSRRSCAR